MLNYFAHRKAVNMVEAKYFLIGLRQRWPVSAAQAGGHQPHACAQDTQDRPSQAPAPAPEARQEEALRQRP